MNNEKNTLSHYGVKGMKWGVRRDRSKINRNSSTDKQKAAPKKQPRWTPNTKKIVLGTFVGVSLIGCFIAGQRYVGNAMKNAREATSALSDPDVAQRIQDIASKIDLDNFDATSYADMMNDVMRK